MRNSATVSASQWPSAGTFVRAMGTTRSRSIAPVVRPMSPRAARWSRSGSARRPAVCAARPRYVRPFPPSNSSRLIFCVDGAMVPFKFYSGTTLTRRSCCVSFPTHFSSILLNPIIPHGGKTGWKASNKQLRRNRQFGLPIRTRWQFLADA